MLQRTLKIAAGILRATLFLLAAVVAIVIFAAALTAWKAKQICTLPTPTGPYAVGRGPFSWQDDSRLDPFAPEKSAKREMFVWAWYPASPQEGSRPAEYLPSAWREAYPTGRLDQQLDRVRAHALDSPPLSGARPDYPVLIFAPGFGELPTNYTALIEDLASHGYVVLAVAHPFVTTAVVFPDGHVSRATESAYRKDSADMVRILASDIVSVTDHLVAEHDRNGSFFARLDPKRIGVLGHSIGGAAAAEACTMDPRLKAGMDFDGTVYADAVTSGVRQPFFMMMSIKQPSEDQMLAHSDNAYRLTVDRLGHKNFNDKGFFFDPGDRLAELFGFRRDALETTQFASRYARAFFGEYLLGVHSPGHELEKPTDEQMLLEQHRAATK